MPGMFDKAELAGALARLLGDWESDEDQESFMQWMNERIVDPYWSEYVFQTDEFVLGDDQFDFDGLCDKILSYRPIMMGDGKTSA